MFYTKFSYGRVIGCLLKDEKQNITGETYFSPFSSPLLLSFLDILIFVCLFVCLFGWLVGWLVGF
jgi:hypothetical protein